MKKLLIVLILVFTQTSLSYAKTETSELSGAKDQLVGFILLSDGIDWDAPIMKLIKDNNALYDKVKHILGEAPAEGVQPGEGVPQEEFAIIGAIGLATPLIIGGTKLIWNLYMDKKIQKIKDRRKSAQRSYSGRVIGSVGEFSASRYAVLVRYSKKGENSWEINFIVIAKIIQYSSNEGFSIQPLLVMARNAVAITGKQKDKKAPKIDLSIALSVKAVGKQESELPGLFSVGKGVVSVPNVEIYSEWDKCKHLDSVETSDLIPYSGGGDSSLVSVTMSITESGQIGIDFDQTIAELTAIKEAIGPALSETVKNYLEKLKED